MARPRLLLRGVSSIASLGSFAAATLDLNLVRSVRAATQTAPAASQLTPLAGIALGNNPSPATLAEVLPAALDLQLVELIRGAIANADLAVAGQTALGGSQLTPLAGIALGNNPGPATLAEVLPAALDLQLVQLIRAAMADADLVVAAQTPLPSATPQPQPEIRTVVESSPRIQSPPVIEREVVIEQASKIQPMSAPPPLSPSSLPPSSGQSRPHDADLYPQPPWRFLPWPHHDAVRASVKRVAAVPDILIKGLLIDLFL